MNTQTNGANGAHANGAVKVAAKPEPAKREPPKPVAPRPFASAKVNGRYTKETQEVVLAAMKKAGGTSALGEKGLTVLAAQHGVTRSVAYWWWARSQGKSYARGASTTVAKRVERANAALASVNKERPGTAMTPLRTVRQLLADARKAGVVIKSLVVDHRGRCKVTLEVTEDFAL